MRYCIDIDGCICTNTRGKYDEAEPCQLFIMRVNMMFDEGHHIMLFTARGTTTGIDWRDVTVEQLTRWGVKYHELVFGKPEYDVIVDDKSMSLDDFVSPELEMPDHTRSKV